MAKNILQSKTFWLGVATIILGASQVSGAIAQLGQHADFWAGFAIVLSGVAAIINRFFTTMPVCVSPSKAGPAPLHLFDPPDKGA